MGGLGSGNWSASKLDGERALAGIRKLTPRLVKLLMAEADKGSVPAMCYLLDRCYGKPKQQLDVDQRLSIEPMPDQYAIAARLIAREQGLLAPVPVPTMPSLALENVASGTFDAGDAESYTPDDCDGTGDANDVPARGGDVVSRYDPGQETDAIACLEQELADRRE